jgi:hypothetical protein
MSIVHLKLKISGHFRKAKAAWHDNPAHHGTEEIPLPPAQEVLPRQRLKCNRTHCGPDPNRALEVGGISEENLEKDR